MMVLELSLRRLFGWHTEGLMPAEGWPAGAGTAYKNAAPLFLDGTVAMHMSGSWMLGNYDKNITNFEWKVVPDSMWYWWLWSNARGFWCSCFQFI